MNVGILGGGQLALLLASAAGRLGLTPVVYAENSFSPAVAVCSNAVFGSLDDENALSWFFSQVSCVVFENEFVNCAVLERAAAPYSIQFFPKLEVIQNVQDKLRQKELFQELEIQTAPHLILDLQAEGNQSKKIEKVRKELKRALDFFHGSCVLKWARLGYDGKGVFVIQGDLENSPPALAQAEEFCLSAVKVNSPVYAEAYVPFRRELAMLGLYSVQGEFRNYPLVISEQKSGVCYRVLGPANHLGVSGEIENLARTWVEKVARSLGLVGVFALEFFETDNGQIFVNEIAPRVHNSGHYTQNGCSTDQFENHWRAVLSYPLGRVDFSSAFGMLNFLGPKDVSEETLLPMPGPRCHLHWYGKRGMRPGRKLGHLNGVADTSDEMPSLLAEMNDCYENWLTQVTHLHSEGKKDENSR